jgi:hypothetical protein
MKVETGWGVAALVALALVSVGSRQSGQLVPETVVTHSRPAGRQALKVKTARDRRFEDGPCVELEDTIQNFVLSPPDDIAVPESCYAQDEAGEQEESFSIDPQRAESLAKKTRSLKFVIAILPDPLHTHFSLLFDRIAESIQQGAQDENYSYDSSWLPWETQEHTLESLADIDEADKRKNLREEQPGVLLFRKAPGVDESKARPSRADALYPDGLAVFVVGEEPTTGIHKRQFENAVHWITTLRGQPAGSTASPNKQLNILGPKILGPTFSGSLPSLAQLLTNQELSTEIAKLVPENELLIYSGGITSRTMVQWFVRNANANTSVRPTFRSFQQSDEEAIRRYSDYLARQGVDLSHLAIISEDETAFGTHPAHPSPDNAKTTHLYYPRDISALRGAYQKESIFNKVPIQQSADTVRRTLSTDIADPEGQEHDTIRTFSGKQTPLSQEAVLQQIVSMLRIHHSEYVVLRSSNPMDQLFLSHFLRLAYPEGRIVIQGADLLLRRESGAADLSGIMTLSTYPLLPWEDHWTALSNTPHSHRVFAGDIAEGIYVASRFLLCGSASGNRCVPDGSIDDGFLPPNLGTVDSIRDYAPPFWAKPLCKGQQPCASDRRPSTWLSVLGRDGFWPVAALNVGIGSDSKVDSTNVTWPAMPTSMNVCLLGVFLWVLFHFLCCTFPSLTVKPAYRAHFVRVTPGESHLALIVLGSVVISLVPILLGWSYGETSQTGGPILHPLFYMGSLAFIVLIASGAVCANAWFERGGTDRAGSIFRAGNQNLHKWRNGCKLLLATTRGPLFCYAVSTYFFYYLLNSCLNENLTDANRIPTYWRSINLTSGVSPLMPLLALAAALYAWFWYSLQGLSLFREDRPLLPRNEHLEIQGRKGEELLSMFSDERAGLPIETLCHPFAKEVYITAGILFVALWPITRLLAGAWLPIRSLGSSRYCLLVSGGINICVSLMLASAWQLLRVWLRLRQLLVFLDRLPLRRTMRALKGYSWGSVWKMSGNVIDVRYKLLSRQRESLTHLINFMGANDEFQIKPQIKETQTCMKGFAIEYSKKWDEWKWRNLHELHAFQQSIA